MPNFEEGKHPRDEHGRFSEGEGHGAYEAGPQKRPAGVRTPKEAKLLPKFKTPTSSGIAEGISDKTQPRTLKKWASSRATSRPETSLAEKGPGVATEAKGASKGRLGGKARWDEVAGAYGPLAGKVDRDRFAARSQKELFPQGPGTLTEGTHFLKRSVGDPFGKELTPGELKAKGERRSDPDALDAMKADKMVTQSFQDLQTRFPGVGDYLKKHPLTEVQARAGRAEWGTLRGKDVTAATPTYGYQYTPLAGQYTSAFPKGLRDEQKAKLGPHAPEPFQHETKPGDVIYVPGSEIRQGTYTEEGAALNPFQPPKGTIPRGLHLGDPGYEKKFESWKYDPERSIAFSMSGAAQDDRTAALSTALHEIGHHIALGGAQAYLDKRGKDKTEEQAVEDYFQMGLPGHPDPEPGNKDHAVLAAINRGYGKERAGNNRPFTRYAASSPQEWFAEAFAAIHMRPDYLKQASPIAYKTVKKVMKIKGIALPDPVRKGTPPLLKWAGQKPVGTRPSEEEAG